MRMQQPAVSAAAQKVSFSASACLLRLFEISLRRIRNLSELMSVLSELMPFGMGSFAQLVPFGMVSRACAYWHGFGLASLMPFGMGKVNIANITLY